MRQFFEKYEKLEFAKKFPQFLWVLRVILNDEVGAIAEFVLFSIVFSFSVQ